MLTLLLSCFCFPYTIYISFLVPKDPMTLPVHSVCSFLFLSFLFPFFYASFCSCFYSFSFLFSPLFYMLLLFLLLIFFPKYSTTHVHLVTMQPTKERRLRAIPLDSVAAGTSVWLVKVSRKNLKYIHFLALQI